MPNNINTIHMKKTYLSPEVEVNLVTFEQCILSNGEDLNIRAYGSGVGEDEEDFWD